MIYVFYISLVLKTYKMCTIYSLILEFDSSNTKQPIHFRDPLLGFSHHLRKSYVLSLFGTCSWICMGEGEAYNHEPSCNYILSMNG